MKTDLKKVPHFPRCESLKASQRLESATSSDEERMNSELLLLSAARAGESPTIFVKAAKQTLT